MIPIIYRKLLPVITHKKNPVYGRKNSGTWNDHGRPTCPGLIIWAVQYDTQCTASDHS